MMDKLDEWAADRCGVVPSAHNEAFRNSSNGTSYYYPWTLSDPRCMRIFREKFRVNCGWCSQTSRWKTNTLSMRGNSRTNPYNCADGKTIEEAEMSCAQQVFKGETNPPRE